MIGYGVIDKVMAEKFPGVKYSLDFYVGSICITIDTDDQVVGKDVFKAVYEALGMPNLGFSVNHKPLEEGGEVDPGSMPWMTQDVSGLKVGDDAYCLINGHGVVTNDVHILENYPITCVFNNGNKEAYTTGGLIDTVEGNQSLFKGKHHPFNPQPNPLGVRIGDAILVKDKWPNSKWIEGVFTGYIESSNYPWHVVIGNSGVDNFFVNAKLQEKETFEEKCAEYSRLVFGDETFLNKLGAATQIPPRMFLPPKQPPFMCGWGINPYIKKRPNKPFTFGAFQRCIDEVVERSKKQTKTNININIFVQKSGAIGTIKVVGRFDTEPKVKKENPLLTAISDICNNATDTLWISQTETVVERLAELYLKDGGAEDVLKKMFPDIF